MNKWQSVHNAMFNDIEICQNLPLPEIKKVEMCFKIPLEYWDDIKEDLNGHVFQNEAEEINFYKQIKPSFTAYIEYFTKLYLELCFAPQEDKEMSLIFWTGEMEKLQKFIEKNVEFIDYYRSGKTHNDHFFFLPQKDAHEKTGSIKIYDTASPFLTTHDHLVAEFIAQEMFHEYTKRKCKYLQQSLSDK